MSTLHTMTDGWFALACAVTWQLAALAALAWVCERALRLRQPRARHALWWFVLLAPLALAPLRMALVRHQAVVEIAAPASVARTFSAAPAAFSPAPPALHENDTVRRPSASPTPPTISQPWWRRARPADMLMLVWLLGCAILAARLLVGHRRVRRMLADSRAVEDTVAVDLLSALCLEAGVRRAVRLRSSEAVGAPLLCGLRRPAIVVPEDWVGALGPDEVRALVAHEVAHIKRRDFLANLAQRVLEALLFFHPLAWVASRRITQAREELCDAWALTRGADPVSYAHSLAAAAERAHAGIAAASVGIAESRFTLLRRVQAVMDTSSGKRLGIPLAIGLAALLAASAAVFAAVQIKSPEVGPPGFETAQLAFTVLLDNGKPTAATITALDSGPGKWPTLRVDCKRGAQCVWTRPRGSRIESSRLLVESADGTQSALVTIAWPESGKLKQTIRLHPRTAVKGEANAQAVKISGRVVDEHGRLVEGASMWLSVYDHPEIPFVSRDIGFTGSDGRFSADLGAALEAPNRLTAQPWWGWVAADKPGYGVAWARLEQGGRLEGLQITLGPAAVLRGKVMDADGKPLPEIEVAIAAIGAPSKGMLPGGWGGFRSDASAKGPSWASTRTDAQGEFALADLPADSWVKVDVSTCGAGASYRADQASPQLSPVTLAKQRGDLIIKLERMPVMEGTLLLPGPGKKPANGVEIQGEGKLASQPHFVHFRLGGGGQIRTDKNGHYRIVLNEPGTYTLWALDDHYFAVIAEKRDICWGRRVELPQTVLAKVGRIEGRVLDAQTGKPLAATSVYCESRREWRVLPHPSISASAQAGADGRYSIAAPPGKVLLQAGPPKGYTWSHKAQKVTIDGRPVVRVTASRDRPDTRMLDVKSGDTVRNADLFLMREAGVTGLVVGPDGKPWRHGGRVEGELDRDRVASATWPPLGEAIRPDGTFSIRYAYPGVPIVLVVFDEKHEMAGGVRVTPTRGKATKVTIQMQPAVRAVGRVLMPTGGPGSGAEVVRQSGVSPKAKCDANGRFEVLGGVAGFPCVIRAYLPPYSEWNADQERPAFQGASKRFEVAPGQQVVDVGEIVMKPVKPPSAEAKASESAENKAGSGPKASTPTASATGGRKSSPPPGGTPRSEATPRIVAGRNEVVLQCLQPVTFVYKQVTKLPGLSAAAIAQRARRAGAREPWVEHRGAEVVIHTYAASDAEWTRLRDAIGIQLRGQLPAYALVGGSGFDASRDFSREVGAIIKKRIEFYRAPLLDAKVVGPNLLVLSPIEPTEVDRVRWAWQKRGRVEMRLLPKEYQVRQAMGPTVQEWRQSQVVPAIMLAKSTLVITNDVPAADAQVRGDQEGAIMVTLQPQAAARMRELTARAINRHMAIVMDGTVVSAPVVKAALGPEFIIEQRRDSPEDSIFMANQLAACLKSGLLPTMVTEVPRSS